MTITTPLIINRNDTRANAGSRAGKAGRLPALTGIRFFAIFHIFMFQFWSLYNLEKPERFSNSMIGFVDLPKTLVKKSDTAEQQTSNAYMPFRPTE